MSDADVDQTIGGSPARRARKSLVHLFDDVQIIRRLGSLGARPQVICMLLGGDGWSPTTVAGVLKEYFGRGGKPGRKPIGISLNGNPQTALHSTLAYFLGEMAKLWRKNDAYFLAELYEQYHYLTSNIQESRLTVENCVPFSTSLKLMNLDLANCCKCKAPRVLRAGEIKSLFQCEACIPVRASNESSATEKAA